MSQVHRYGRKRQQLSTKRRETLTDAEFRRASVATMRRFADAFAGLAAYDRGEITQEDLRDK